MKVENCSQAAITDAWSQKRERLMIRTAGLAACVAMFGAAAQAEAVARHGRWLRRELVTDRTPPTPDAIRTALAGRNLACWCRAGSPCHADSLLEIANK